MENNTKDIRNHLNDKNLYELLRRKEKFSEYIDGSYEEHIGDAIRELQELLEAIENKDNKEINKESVDVVYAIGQLLNKLNRDGVEFDFKSHKEKILQRSPQLKQCKRVSREVENILWHKNKKGQNL